MTRTAHRAACLQHRDELQAVLLPSTLYLDVLGDDASAGAVHVGGDGGALGL